MKWLIVVRLLAVALAAAAGAVAEQLHPGVLTAPAAAALLAAVSAASKP